MAVLERFSVFYEDLSYDNLALLKDIYSQDVTFIDPVTEHKGLGPVKQYFERLLDNTEQCKCVISRICSDQHVHMVQWQMTYRHPRLKKGGDVVVNGVSELHIVDDKIAYHRDYYDMGEMIYEHLPLLGWAVRHVKQRMAK